ncbi:uncharacterized protein ARMOST_17917 [Armillaria ostoyae]|uniref:F-box domain-containing protein n=1 Tax=Armillaria ostoyae TaxID=47428 RepID=A0A284S0D0_ARMOS|nr:uncharacterized protein ARMOST_17917 [Armillaria ostoyae]
MTHEPIPGLRVLFSIETLLSKVCNRMMNRSSMSSSNPTATKHHFPSIPPEPIDETIDYLWDNKDALVACSFVCRLFYLRTRVHLFHSIELKHTPNDEPSSRKILPYIKKITIHRGSDNLNIPHLTPFLFRVL